VKHEEDDNELQNTTSVCQSVLKTIVATRNTQQISHCRVLTTVSEKKLIHRRETARRLVSLAWQRRWRLKRRSSLTWHAIIQFIATRPMII